MRPVALELMVNRSLSHAWNTRVLPVVSVVGVGAGGDAVSQVWRTAQSHLRPRRRDDPRLPPRTRGLLLFEMSELPVPRDSEPVERIGHQVKPFML